MCNHLEPLLLQMFHPSLFCLSNYTPSTVNLLTARLRQPEPASGREREDRGSEQTGERSQHLQNDCVLSSTSAFFLVPVFRRTRWSRTLRDVFMCRYLFETIGFPQWMFLCAAGLLVSECDVLFSLAADPSAPA